MTITGRTYLCHGNTGNKLQAESVSISRPCGAAHAHTVADVPDFCSSPAAVLSSKVEPAWVTWMSSQTSADLEMVGTGPGRPGLFRQEPLQCSAQLESPRASAVPKQGCIRQLYSQ